MNDWPRQLSDFDRLPGVIKADYSDFVVEEIPLYPADGAGTHTYFLVEKAGLSTMQAVHDLAKALNRRRHEIGFAGLKDARAITRQWMSIEHVPPETIQRLSIPRLRILAVTRHHNKLRLGHLRANAFVIKVRQTRPERLEDLRAALAELERRGVPNYFGTQRFGYRGDTWRVGRSILHGLTDEAVDLLLGRPETEDRHDIRRARQLYDQGQYAAAARLWPRLFHSERRMLKVLERTAGNRRKALAAIDRSTLNFYISAYQSHLFNQVVSSRLPSGLGRLYDGDLAWVHASGAVFRVTAASVEQPRADAFEISPTGPLLGYRMSTPTETAGELEQRALGEEQPPAGAFHRSGLRVKGGRRPLRFPVSQAAVALGADHAGPYLEMRFVLPRGCYATALLRELFRIDAADKGSESEDAEVPPDE